MKKRDIIIITVCVATALICIALTFWGNYKNNGVLSDDAFYGVLATFVGICATIIVGFQIASFVKINETEKQIKEVRAERDKMQIEKEQLRREISFVESELSNAFVILSNTTKDTSLKIFAKILSISCADIKEEPNVTLRRYNSLHAAIQQASDTDIVKISKFVNKLKEVEIPKEIDGYTEIMKLHIEILDILEKAKKQ